MTIHEIKLHSLPEADLYIFSAPDAFGKIVRSMRKFLEKIELKNSTAHSILVNTYLDSSFSDDKDLGPMEEILKEKISLSYPRD